MLNFFSSFCLVYLMIYHEGIAQQAYYDDCENENEIDCCTGPHEINSAAGRLCSPYYPDRYRENIHCEWQISSPVKDAVLEIRFEDFAMETSPGCAYDYLEFRSVPNTPNGDDRVLGRFCGENKPERFTTPSNKVYVIFHSDVNNVCQGFCFSWRSLQVTTLQTNASIAQEDELADPGEVICRDANIANGYADCTNANNVGSTCTYSCYFGYSLTGFTTSTCVLPNGADQAAWLPTLPMCLVGLSWGAIALLTLGILGLLGLLCLCCSALRRRKKDDTRSRSRVLEAPVSYAVAQHQHAHGPSRSGRYSGYNFSNGSNNPCTGNPATCPICESSITGYSRH